MSEHHMATMVVKKKLSSLMFPKGDDDGAIFELVQMFCMFLSERLQDPPSENYITPQTFVMQYFDALKIFDDPEMEPLLTVCIGNIAKAIFPEPFAEEVTEEAISYLIMPHTPANAFIN